MIFAPKRKDQPQSKDPYSVLVVSPIQGILTTTFASLAKK